MEAEEIGEGPPPTSTFPDTFYGLIMFNPYDNEYCQKTIAQPPLAFKLTSKCWKINDKYSITPMHANAHYYNKEVDMYDMYILEFSSPDCSGPWKEKEISIDSTKCAAFGQIYYRVKHLPFENNKFTLQTFSDKNCTTASSKWSQYTKRACWTYGTKSFRPISYGIGAQQIGFESFSDSDKCLANDNFHQGLLFCSSHCFTFGWGFDEKSNSYICTFEEGGKDEDDPDDGNAAKMFNSAMWMLLCLILVII